VQWVKPSTFRLGARRNGTQPTSNAEQARCPLWVKSRHFRMASAMSGLPPKADIAERQLDVRFVPKADIPLEKRAPTVSKFDFLDRSQRRSERGCGETYRCCWLGPTAFFSSDPLLTQSRRVQAKSRHSLVGSRLCCFRKRPARPGAGRL
jgi:hypothetical protein